MATLFGDKQRFAAEVGEFWGGSTQLRRVDLWAAERWLTCDDNTAFVSAVCLSVRAEIAEVVSGRLPLTPSGALPPVERHRQVMALDDGTAWHHRFPDWGPTTDNVQGLLHGGGERLTFTFEFWRPCHPRPEELGRVYVAELPAAELVGVLEQLLAALERGAEPLAAADRGGIAGS